MNNGRILVMDDEEDIRYVFTRILNRLNYDVEVASDGNEAIELFKCAMKQKKPFNIVIVDLVVGNGMGGDEAIKRLLEIDEEVKIILCSGSVSEEIMVDYKAHGIRAIIHKPFKVDDLSKTLQIVSQE